MVEVVEVGEQQRRPARVDGLARQLPGRLGVGVGAQPQRGPGQLEEVLLEPRRAAVGEARGRVLVEDDVVEAGAGAEPERHLLGDLDAVEGEQVAQRGRAAVVARARAGSPAPSPGWRSRPSADCATRYSAPVLARLDNRLLYAMRTRFHGPAAEPSASASAGSASTARSGSRSGSCSRFIDPDNGDDWLVAGILGPVAIGRQLRGQADRPAAAPGARGPAAARRRAELAQLPLGAHATSVLRLRDRDDADRPGGGGPLRPRRGDRRLPALPRACTTPPTCSAGSCSASALGLVVPL